MKFTKLIPIVSISAIAAAGLAPKVSKNPKKVVAVADFPEFGANKFTKGYVFFTSPKGKEIKVHIDVTGLPKVGGPFYYHIHANPVNTDTCEDAGGHFDPYYGLSKCPLVGDDAACQVGDLSGKHGWINTTCFQTEYFDPFLSLQAKNPAYVVGRSLVIHKADQSRFACANINVATKEQYKQLFDAVVTAEVAEVAEAAEVAEVAEAVDTTLGAAVLAAASESEELTSDSNMSGPVTIEEKEAEAQTNAKSNYRNHVAHVRYVNGTAAQAESSARGSLPALLAAIVGYVVTMGSIV